MIVQAAVAGAVGASVAAKVAWRRISGGRAVKKNAALDTDTSTAAITRDDAEQA
jgi:hypothetical protein